MVHRISCALAAALVVAAPGAGRTQPIAFDAASTGQLRNTSSVSWSHTVGAGSNRLLVVGIGTEDNPGQGDSVVTGVTFNGVALTRVAGAQQQAASAGSENITDLWFMLSPPVGTGTVAVNLTGTVLDLMAGGV